MTDHFDQSIEVGDVVLVSNSSDSRIFLAKVARLGNKSYGVWVNLLLPMDAIGNYSVKRKLYRYKWRQFVKTNIKIKIYDEED